MFKHLLLGAALSKYHSKQDLSINRLSRPSKTASVDGRSVGSDHVVAKAAGESSVLLHSQRLVN